MTHSGTCPLGVSSPVGRSHYALFQIMLSRQYSVVSYGNRDAYEIPFALHEVGALSCLLTDFYSPDWLVRLSRRLRSAPFKQAIESRFHPGVSSAFSRNCLLTKSLYDLFLKLRGLSIHERDRHLDCLLSTIALKHLLGHPGEALLCYSYYWKSIDRALSQGLLVQPVYFFQVHPCVSQVQAIIQADRAMTGLTYLPEPEEVFPDHLEERFIACLRNSSGIIAASSFTVKGLADRGVNSSKIRVVPYGAFHDNATTSQLNASLSDSRWMSHQPLRLLWVGQLSYRKAAHHLFTALRSFSGSQVQLTIVSRSQMPKELAALCPDNARFVSGATDSLKTELYCSHHLFVLPSLVEGFGLVYLEALAAGLPILGSSNSGAADIIEDKVHGFIVHPGDPDAIQRVIDTCLSEPSLLQQMSVSALSLARSLTWSRFRAGIRQSLADFESESTP
jgi:glycosyltransferase involved in cell wall biosynthesis